MTPRTAALALKDAPQAGRSRKAQEKPRVPWKVVSLPRKKGAWGELMPMVSQNFGGTKEKPEDNKTGENVVSAPKGMDTSVNKSTWLGFY